MSSVDDYMIKGRVINSYAKYIHKKWGVEGIQQCKKKVGIDIEACQNDKWVSNTYLDDLLDWMCENHGPEEVRKAGYTVVKERGMVSYVARIAGFERVLDHGIEDIRDSLKFGEVKIKKDGKTALVTLKDITGTSSACHAWQGIFEGTFALTNKEGTVTKTKFQHKNDDACAYLLEWK